LTVAKEQRQANGNAEGRDVCEGSEREARGSDRAKEERGERGGRGGRGEEREGKEWRGGERMG
jgi:hypothetical protein